MTNDHVFPQPQLAPDGFMVGTVPRGGLTKRELFSAMIMQGGIAGLKASDVCDPVACAEHAVAMADALIEALKK